MVPAWYIEKYGDPTENDGLDSQQKATVAPQKDNSDAIKTDIVDIEMAEYENG